MAKRSPILGYNHNVRYRGLVFHVQTEDSGVLSPHLFTHLFYTGVIVSTRKLVYDSGSAEDSIKSLMQAQHKAVLKDLRRGHFDDKIDEYLGTTPGLLPRGSVDPNAAEDLRRSELRLARPSDPILKVDDADSAAPLAVEPELGLSASAPMAAAVVDPAVGPFDVTDPEIMYPSTEPVAKVDLEPPVPAVPRVQTAERKSAPTAVRSNLRADSQAGAVEMQSNATTPTLVPSGFAEVVDDGDSGPEIEIQLELDEPDEAPAPAPARRRIPHDTEQVPGHLQQLGQPGHADEHTRPTIDVSQLSDGIPGLIGGRAPVEIVDGVSGSSIPRLPPPPPEKRASTAVGAASLPPPRPITRPPARPAMTPPQVVARPLITEDSRGNRRESDAVEVYAPLPPSLEPVERPGQYAQHKKVSQRLPTDLIGKPNVPIPPGLGRPGRPPSTPHTGMRPPVPPPRADSRGDTARAEQIRAEQQRAEQLRSEAGARVDAARAEAALRAAEHARTELHVRDHVPRESVPVPQRARATGATGAATAEPPQPPVRSRTPTPTRASQGSGPTPSRTGTNNNSSASGGVVMTRPAVIVGAPSKSTNPPRVRRAREDEGRGFGQGLISEKSLDEVILAYLSEDSEDK